MSDLILIDERPSDRLLIATLNRPEASNGIDRAMAEALMALAQRIEASPHLDAVILTGKGRAFCSGGDVALFQKTLADPDPQALSKLLDQLATSVHGALQRLSEAGPLLVGAINGAATGGGLGLACVCDISYATPNATLRAGFSKLGLTPDSGTSYFLQRRMGPQRALEFLLSGEPLKAAQAHEMGLFNAVIEGEAADFLPTVIRRTHTLIACGAAARGTRALLRSARDTPLAEQLLREQQALVKMAASDVGLSQLRDLFKPN